MQKILLVFILLFWSYTLIAQTKDSVQQIVMGVITDKFPITRVLNLTFESNAGYSYSSKLHGRDLSETKVESMYQAGGSININFLKSRTWNLGTNIGYQFTSVNSSRPDLVAHSITHLASHYHYQYESLNLTRYSRLWGKVAFYTATVATNGSEKAIERVNGMLSATVVLKATQEIQMAVGIIGIIDPAAILPILPTFAYKQQFGKGMILDVILPKGIYLRKGVLWNGRVSIGSDLNSTIFYLYNFPSSEKVYTFNQMEINSGLTYEHNLGRSFIATFKSGIKAIPRARIFEKNKPQRDYIWEASPEPSFYMNAGLSFNPFAKKRK